MALGKPEVTVQTCTLSSGGSFTSSPLIIEVRKRHLWIFSQTNALICKGYADSTDAEMFEDTIVEDAVQTYKWLELNNFTRIFVWGHSLGSALATRTVAELKKEGIVPMGLVLESAFTSMREELPLHKYGKV